MKYFILGILFITVILPILESLISIIVQALQLVQTKIAVATYKIKLELQQEEGQEQEGNKHYGFYSCPQPQSLSTEEEYEDQ